VQNAELVRPGPEYGRSYEFLKSMDDEAARVIPTEFIGRLVTAVSQAGAIALWNRDVVIQSSCFELASAIGMRIAEAPVDSESAIEVGVDELQAAASVLDWMVERITVHGWVCERPEYSDRLAAAFQKDAERVKRYLNA
jgi:hypothetical protein